MPITNKSDCWMCCIQPGRSIAEQICGELRAKRDNYCDEHNALLYKENPSIKLVNKDTAEQNKELS